MTEPTASERYLAMAREAAGKIGLDANATEALNDELARQIDEECAMLRADATEPQRVMITPDGGEPYELAVTRPRMQRYLAAFGRLRRAARSIGQIVAVVVDLKDELNDPETAVLVLTSLLDRLGDDPDQAMADVMGAVDALLGQPEGFCGELDPGEFMAVLAALIRVIEPERYAPFFDHLRRAARERLAMGTLRRAGEAILKAADRPSPSGPADSSPPSSTPTPDSTGAA